MVSTAIHYNNNSNNNNNNNNNNLLIQRLFLKSPLAPHINRKTENCLKKK